MSIPARSALPKFARGPAKETQRLPILGFLKYLGFMGTGLAQPKLKRYKTDCSDWVEVAERIEGYPSRQFCSRIPEGQCSASVSVFMHSDRKKDHGYVYNHFLDATKHGFTSSSHLVILSGIPDQDKE